MKTTKPFRPPLYPAMVAACAVAALAGCATTAPEATFTRTLPPDSVVDANDAVTVTVEAKPGVVLTGLERERLAQGIAAKIDVNKLQNTAARDEKTYRIDVRMTRYDKGDAFARMMLAGLGQIHIDAQVAVVDLSQNTAVTEFTVEKTFAWGGIYGVSQSIEDVEEGFGKAVAEAVTKTGK